MSVWRFNKIAAGSAPPTDKGDIFLETADGKLKFKDWQGATWVLSPDDLKDNLLINGGFEFAQRQVPTTATTYNSAGGRPYTFDRWGLQNENASVNVQQIDVTGAPETGLVARQYAKFIKITSAGKMIVSQVIEGRNMAPVRGRVVRFSCKMKYSVAAAMTVRMGILELSSAGTVDTVTAAYASVFGAAGTDPTWTANLALRTPNIVETSGAAGNISIANSAITCVLTNAWVRYSGTFTISSSCKNIIPQIWTNGQPAALDELNIAEMTLSDGEEVCDWTPRLSGHELLLCQRYYCKTFPLLTAPAQNAGVSGALRSGVAIGAAVTTSSIMQWRFPTQMRAAPTVVFFNPSAANAFMRNVPAATDATATSSANVTADEADINATGLAAWTAGQEIKVHATAEAEL